MDMWLESNGWRGWPYIWKRWNMDHYSCGGYTRLATYLVFPFFSICYTGKYRFIDEETRKKLDQQNLKWMEVIL